MISDRLEGETANQYLLRKAQEELDKATYKAFKAEREKAYWQRAVDYHKSQEAA